MISPAWSGLLGERTFRVRTRCPVCDYVMRLEREVRPNEVVPLLCVQCETSFRVRAPA